MLKSLKIVWHEHHLAPVIEAMCRHHEIKEAFIMLDFMRKNNLEPTLETAAPIYNLVKGDVDAVDDAWGKLEEIREEGGTVDIVAFNIVVKAAVEAVAEISPRVGLVLKADIRPGFEGQLTAKVERIEDALRDQ